ncbi:Uncharacterised protein [Mycoplasmopsis citelli]|uniref:Immunoglobulin-blocking virulence protein n=1 Tax=Mycoplasmopsis citelli TaxID=171281 RepID=A0A449B2Z7_9BACT|nr:putative immunoglobulin-blocking virulence protein [Mycoplasmopsis citelli]VEU74968.1 Uncharacterised protein [Mycoplasmopsis citelli]
MIKAKKQKILLNLSPFTAVGAISAVAAVVVYSSINKNASNQVFISSREINSNLINNAVQTDFVHASNKDNNLKKSEPVKQIKEEVVPPKKEEIKKVEPLPKPIVQPKPVVTPPKPKVAPVVEKPKPVVEPKKVIVETPKPAVVEPPKVLNVSEGAPVDTNALPDLDTKTLSSKPAKGNITSGQKVAIKNAISVLAQIGNNLPREFDEATRKKFIDAIEEYTVAVSGKPANFSKEWYDQYFHLIKNDGKNLEEKLADAKKNGIGDILGFWRTDNIDPSYWFKYQYQQIQKDLDKELDNGMIPIISLNPTEIGGIVWGYADPSKNPVRNRQIANNKKRFFGYTTEYQRSPYDIINNQYEGWKTVYDTTSWTSFGITENEGIKVLKIQPESDFAKEQSKGQPRILVELDAANPKGYGDFLKFLQNVEKDPSKKIDAIVIRNMGKVDKKQKFENILSQLPNSVKKLTLVFSAHDTSSLKGLKNKNIEELELYTSAGGIDGDWGINPNSLKGVKYISFDYEPTNKNAGSIVFDRLRFDTEDNLSTINDGLKMVFDTRKDERVFQGYWGPGSWPLKLDFGNIPSIRSLKGMNLYGKVFKELTLYNASNTFEVDLPTLTQQQWYVLIVKGLERAKLYFKSPTRVDTLYLKGNTIPSSYGRDLYGLIEAGKDLFNTVYVDTQEIANTLNQSQAFRTFHKTAVVKPSSFNPKGGTNDISFD